VDALQEPPFEVRPLCVHVIDRALHVAEVRSQLDQLCSAAVLPCSEIDVSNERAACRGQIDIESPIRSLGYVAAPASAGLRESHVRYPATLAGLNRAQSCVAESAVHLPGNAGEDECLSGRAAVSVISAFVLSCSALNEISALRDFSCSAAIATALPSSASKIVSISPLASLAMPSSYNNY